jgi:hypothetical protein
VHYVKRNFLAGREVSPLPQANRAGRQWCLTTAGERVHGTTKAKPLERFCAVEQGCLKPLPEVPYDLTVWKQAKLHRDCYVVFAGSFYSAPFRLVGQKLWVCAGSRQVRVYTGQYELVATHARAQKPGQRQTHLDHLPPEKLPGLLLEREPCLAEAQAIGPATLEVVQPLLEDPVLDRLPTVGRLLRLRKRYGDARLEAACARALVFADPSYKTIKRILAQGLELEPAPIPVVLPAVTTFARRTEELVGTLAEVQPWN